MKVLVILPHGASYPDPLAVRGGEALVLGERDPDSPGWIRCVDPRGKVGWTPETWLVERADGWVCARDHDARELTVTGDEVLDLVEEYAGWALCRRAGGETGWVPLAVLHPVAAEGAP